MNISLHFESRLQASPEQLWRWITPVDGILREIRPLLSMSVPPGIRSLEDLEVVPGARCSAATCACSACRRWALRN